MPTIKKTKETFTYQKRQVYSQQAVSQRSLCALENRPEETSRKCWFYTNSEQLSGSLWLCAFQCQPRHTSMDCENIEILTRLAKPSKLY